MPRRTLETWTPLARPRNALAARLAEELTADRAAGQPLVYEQAFPKGKRRVVVIWDEWAQLPLEERSATILQAYELAFGVEERERIALASGWTVPEAHAGGLLPFQVIPAVRKGDPITRDQVRAGLLDEGGTSLFGPEVVQLRFATEAEAEASKERLARRFPGTEEVWLITREFLPSESPE